ncbi:MAG: hypothetical protein IID41_05345 [Planctomycetes bacterium]|nr:hypothetical protein [Planctomycetota bacterium]
MSILMKNRRRAVAGVWFAMFGMIMTLFVGLAIDTSFYVYTAQQLQNIADASSLAGAIVVRDGIDGDSTDPIELANDWAIAIAAANKAAEHSPDNSDSTFVLSPNYGNNLPDADIEVGNWDRTTGVFTLFDPDNPPPPPGPFDPPLSNFPNAVRVVARRTSGSPNHPLPLLFGPIVGVNTAEVEASAVAMIGGGFGAGLIVLAPDGRCSLKLGGNVTLDVGDAGIQVNSDADCGACGRGSSLRIQAGVMKVVGTACFHPNAEMEIDLGIQEGQDYVDDPLAYLPDPDWDPAQDLGCIPCGLACDGGANNRQACQTDADCAPGGLCEEGVITACDGGANDDKMCSTDADCPGGDCVLSDTVTLDPGYYSGGIRITSSNTAVTLNPGVYVLDNVDGGPPSGLYVNGGDLTANEVMFFVKGEGVVFLAGNGAVEITPSSDLNDIYWGISIFQARDNDNDAIIEGTSDMNLEGTYYFPAALLIIRGNSVALGNQVIAWHVWMQGNATYTIDYDGRFQLPGHDVFIVH